MKNRHAKFHSPIRRNQAEGYILTALVGFAVTVIFTRTFLELSGYPQIGNSVLHIAHALWGGLLLIIAAYLPLAYQNRWALQTSAVLSGIGIGLFIDEVGKFITQANDYFFLPALPLIYSFFLVNVLIYLYFRRPHAKNPRCAMYHVLEGLQDVLDGNMNETKIIQLKAQLSLAKQSDQAETVSLANAIDNFLQAQNHPIPPIKPSLWQQFIERVNELSLTFDRQMHRTIITGIWIGWLLFVTGYIAIIIEVGDNLDPKVLQWRTLLIVIQACVGILLVVATYFWLNRKERLGLKVSITGFLVSLVALQLLYFYISQFLAITVTLLQVSILLVLIAYDQRYFVKEHS
jgi:hypothetical protein